jgi:hypothetical protein
MLNLLNFQIFHWNYFHHLMMIFPKDHLNFYFDSLPYYH